MSPAPLWNSEHATLLVALRQDKGLDAFQLAKLACLSLQQVQELESLTPSTLRSAFYTPGIKAHAGHRLIELLRSRSLA